MRSETPDGLDSSNSRTTPSNSISHYSRIKGSARLTSSYNHSLGCKPWKVLPLQSATRLLYHKQRSQDPFAFHRRFPGNHSSTVGHPAEQARASA